MCGKSKMLQLEEAGSRESCETLVMSLNLSRTSMSHF